jgi:hypothetical protein
MGSVGQPAKSLKFVDSSGVKHLRKAEQRLITHILTSEAQLSLS